MVKRYIYIDYIRVFSIFMVIVLHCICDYYNNLINAEKTLWTILGFVNEITRTGVPLFFMISGFLLLNSNITNIRVFYKHRLLKIGIPFLIYNLIYYLNSPAKKSLGVFLTEFFNSGSSYHLWFIYSILLIYLFVPFIKMAVEKCDLKQVILFLLLLTFQTTIKPFINTVFNGFYVYLSEDGVVGYFGYIVLGYILGKYDFNNRIKCVIYIIGILFMFITPIISMSSAVKTGEFLFHGGYSLNHYVEASAVFLFFKEKVNCENKVIYKLSEATLGAYFIHVLILEKIRLISFKVAPCVEMLIWIFSVTVLSFLWGYIVKCSKYIQFYHIKIKNLKKM